MWRSPIVLRIGRPVKHSLQLSLGEIRYDIYVHWRQRGNTFRIAIATARSPNNHACHSHRGPTIVSARDATGQQQRMAATPHIILFLAANPNGRQTLRLAEECAEIQREIKMAPNRDDFRFESRWAVGIDELMRHLNELNPTVIHFSGHGGGS